MIKKEKQVSIPISLFMDLVKYHCIDCEVDEALIKKGLTDKLDAIAKRELYTLYKTASTQEEKEKARQQYLERAGIHADFRW